MVNAQEWLDKKYSKEERSKITKLDINSKSLVEYFDKKKAKIILKDYH